MVVGVIAVGEVLSNFISREEETRVHKERLLSILLKQEYAPLILVESNFKKIIFI